MRVVPTSRSKFTNTIDMCGDQQNGELHTPRAPERLVAYDYTTNTTRTPFDCVVELGWEGVVVVAAFANYFEIASTMMMR